MKIDTKRTWAIVLEGGGARGAYQIGFWQALNEMGIKFNAVSGASVGALNGAMMAMNDIELAKNIWNNITFSQVMDVNDEIIGDFFKYGVNFKHIPRYLMKIIEVIKNRGISAEPLRKFIESNVDEEKIRNSDINFYFTAYNMTDRIGLELEAKNLGAGEINTMLLASSCYPLFKREIINGKAFIDGGVFDSVPIHALIVRGYKNIIVCRLQSGAVVRRVNIPNGTTVITLKPKKRLGSVLNFSTDIAKEAMRNGYLDTISFFS